MTELDTRAKPASRGFRFDLREATRDEHASLDSHPAFASLLSGRLELHGYARLMALFHAFYRSHDPIIGNACRIHGLHMAGFEYAPRKEILRHDLAALGVEPIAPAQIGEGTLPLMSSAAATCGTLYVVEGSMLGGSVLGGAVGSLFTGTSGGKGYWQWCAQAGAGRWAMTCKTIDNLASDDASRTDMIAAARTAFRTFGAWLALWRDDGSNKALGRARC
ncbi:MAG: biliverdin-producing heme oxygenase [Rhizobiaceae bacterium]|nr:biliverdin-producing heme oxygenase [Rhizobiaceae bacterium]